MKNIAQQDIEITGNTTSMVPYIAIRQDIDAIVIDGAAAIRELAAKLVAHANKIDAAQPKADNPNGRQQVSSCSGGWSLHANHVATGERLRARALELLAREIGIDSTGGNLAKVAEAWPNTYRICRDRALAERPVAV